MANKKVSSKGTGKSGHHSSRWSRRADVKTDAKKARRTEDYALEAAPEGQVYDVVASDNGSVWLLQGLTPEGKEWLDKYLPEDGPRLGDAYGVEARYVQPILDALDADGLNVVHRIT